MNKLEFKQQQEDRAKELFTEIFAGSPIVDNRLLFSRLNALIDSLEKVRSTVQRGHANEKRACR